MSMRVTLSHPSVATLISHMYGDGIPRGSMEQGRDSRAPLRPSSRPSRPLDVPEPIRIPTPNHLVAVGDQGIDTGTLHLHHSHWNITLTPFTCYVLAHCMYYGKECVHGVMNILLLQHLQKDCSIDTCGVSHQSL